MIDHQTTERILSTANIVEVVQDYITLTKRGNNHIGLCPFHHEKTPSFSVNQARGIFKCFGCGEAGNAAKFIMKIEQVGFTDALKILAKKYHIEVEEREPDPQELAQRNERESLMVANAYAQRHFTHLLRNHPDGQNIGMAYFRERGLQEHIVERFQLGYCLDQRDAFTRTAQHDGYALDVLVRTGLTVQRDDGSTFDRFAGRVMFPIHSVAGRVIAFGGRTLRSDKKVAKYLNSPESEIYHKSNSLYGIFFAKRSITQHNKCYMVEGYTDVLSLHQAGIENVVASSGTSLTTDQIRLIKRFTPNLTILYDGDAAGIKASLRGIDMVLEQGMNVKIVLLPEGEDPDSYARAHTEQEVLEYINANETDFIRFKTKLLLREAQDDPIARASLITDLVKTIAIIPESITRSVYIKECAALMDIGEQVLATEVSKQRRERREQESRRSNTSTPTTTPADQQPDEVHTPTIPAYVTNIFCEEQERELIRFLIRDGDKPLNNAHDMPSTTVGEYIINELLGDDLELQNLMFKKLFEAYIANPNPLELLNNEDPEISQLIADILSDAHTLSEKYWNNRHSSMDTPDFLLKAVYKAIQVYKSKVIQMDKQRLTAELSTATPDEAREITLRISHLNSILKDMSYDLKRVAP